MAYIRTRDTLKKGTLYDAVYMEKGHQKRKCGFESRADAVNYLHRLGFLNVETAPILYTNVINEYIKYISITLKESSQYDINNARKLYFDPFWKHNNLMSKWTKQDALQWMDFILNKPIKNRTIHKIHCFFLTFYHWAMQRYELEDIFKGLKTPKKPESKRLYTIWTETDFKAFLQGLDNDKYICLFSTFFYAGLRCGELEALRVKDYDGKTILVNKTYTRKTMDDSSWKITAPKNYKVRRIPVPQGLKDLLDCYTMHRDGNEFLFGKDTPISQNAIRTAFNKQISKTNVPQIRIHDLRHSYVSMLMSKGVNFGVIASLIGDTLEQVVKTYAHATENDLYQAISLI